MLAALAVALFSAGTADDAAELRKLVEANRHPFEIADGALRGAGLEFLVDNARDAAFCLIGESHGSRETPLLARTLLARLRPLGFGAYVLETGPVTTAELVARARKDGVESLVPVFQEFPYTAAFLNFHEEQEAFGDALGLGMEVWGIDQEFVGCCRFLLGELEHRAKDDAARTRVRASYDRAWEGFDHFLTSGDDSRAFMNAPGTEQELDELATALGTGDPTVTRILDEMRASYRVYRHYREGRYFENNAERARLMRRHFTEALADFERRTKAPARALIKLGSVHAGRGFSPMDQLDIGDLAAELAAERGQESFHLYVFARRGADGKDWSSDESLKPFFDALEPGAAAVFDARPLRSFLSARAEVPAFAAVHELCRRYDAIVLFAELHAATDVAPAPK